MTNEQHHHASQPARILWCRPLPVVDPHAHLGPTRRALVAAAGSALARRLSTARLYRQVVWKSEPYLQRVSGGRLTNALGLPTALLQTQGAHTGQWRQAGVIYFHDADRVTIVASQAGRPRNPAWYYNLVANPEVRLGGERFRAHVVVDDDELARYGALLIVFSRLSRPTAEAPLATDGRSRSSNSSPVDIDAPPRAHNQQVYQLCAAPGMRL
jgi:deazaflavin-dependent oxidoreductase (nitroreductase family)